MKKFAVLDIDGTLIRWQLYHAVANTLLKQNKNPKLYNDIRDARMKWKQRANASSFHEYETALIKAYDSNLKNLSVNDFNKAVGEVFEEYKDQVYTFTRDLIISLKQQNYSLIAISGSQQELIDKISTHYGFDKCVGSVYLQKNGHFTGEKKIASKDKASILNQLIKENNLSTIDSYAIGDSQSDISILEMVENPIAFNPDANLYKAARENRWKIVVERKNMIFQLEPKNGSYILA